MRSTAGRFAAAIDDEKVAGLRCEMHRCRLHAKNSPSPLSVDFRNYEALEHKIFRKRNSYGVPRPINPINVPSFDSNG